MGKFNIFIIAICFLFSFVQASINDGETTENNCMIVVGLI